MVVVVVVVVFIVVVWVVVVVVVAGREGERKIEGETSATAVKLPCGSATSTWSC